MCASCAAGCAEGLREARYKYCGRCSEEEEALYRTNSCCSKQGEEELGILDRLNPVKCFRGQRKVDRAVPSISSKSVSVLQCKLDKLAVRVSYIGIAAALLCTVILCLRFLIEEFAIRNRAWDSSSDLSELLHFVIIGNLVLVVAFPGSVLTLITVLAYTVKKMLRDCSLVRHLHACETLGCTTTLCLDITGTLTTNKMTVVESFFADKEYVLYP